MAEKMDVDTNEMDLLEKVLLRFGSAETDEQLESLLMKFLVPILNKLDNNVTRKKVMELLVHVNKRVKSRPKVQLPMVDLLAQFRDPATSPFILNFTMIYVKIGYPRLEMLKQVELLSSMMNSLEGRPPGHQDSLLQLIIPVLGSVEMPSSETEQQQLYSLADKPKSLELFLMHCQNYLLLPYSLMPPPPKNAAASPDGSQPAAPSGMSFAMYRRLVGEVLPTPEEVEDGKVGILKFLATQRLFREQDIGIHFIIAMSDSRHRVATAADKEIKRILGSVDLNDDKFVGDLYSLYQGSPTSKQQALETVRTSANTRIRLKIFPYFLRSKTATNHFPGCLQIIFESLFGQNTNHKLKTMTVQFVHHVCEYSNDDKFLPIASVLLSAMTKFLNQVRTDLKLRGLIYLAIGKIAKRTPNIIATDMTLLNNLFEALSQEEMETRLAVQETLSMLSNVVREYISPSNLPMLEALIMQNIEKEDNQSRLMAVHFAKTVFPLDHVASRYVLLLAAGDSKDDIRSQAVKALTYTPRNEQQLLEVRMDVDNPEKLMPDFGPMIVYVQERADLRMKTNNKYTLGNHTVAFNPGTFAQLLTYLRQCLAYNAGVDLDAEGEAYGPVLGKYVRERFAKGDSSIQSYVEMLIQHLSIFGGPEIMLFLLEIVAVAWDILAVLFVERLDWIRSLMFSERDQIRERAAELYAIVLVTGCPAEIMVERLDSLAKNFDHKLEETVSGSLLGIAHTIGRLFLLNKRATLNDISKRHLEELAKKAILVMDKKLSDTSQVLRLSALAGLGELGRCTSLPLPSESTDESTLSKLSLVNRLLAIVQKTKEPSKVREKAATTLGLFSLGEPGFPHRRVLMDGMIECAGPHQLELHFTVGEALVNAALAHASPVSRDTWTVPLDQFNATLPNRTQNLELSYLITNLLEKANKEENPHKKQALCIWLLSVVKQCGTYDEVQNNLKKIQMAFMHLLIENNEVTQDIASKGLGTVYEVCGPGLKDELVQLLVRTLTTGQTENQNLSTYKELAAIATDLNQPDLVYKFMHLAHINQGVWRQKGARLGFGTVAQQAAEQLAPQLHKIVPKLYRYQYDPNAKIQGAMTSIWAAVVPDTKAIVDQYLSDILNDLLKNLTSGNWRVRESSCLGLADLLRGRTLEDNLQVLPQLWNSCFKVRDDMKESVRNAAETTLRSLNRLTVKLCDVNNGKLGEQAIELVFPPLLENGLLSACKEVRAVGLDTILKVSKNAGALLKPHIPLLVSALLESLSGLEPQVNDYISLHVGNDESTREKLDHARIALSKGSPMMETVNLCTQYVDSSVVAQLVPRLIELIRSGIGVGTKAGVAGYVVSLIQNDPSLLEPYAGKLMSSLLNGLGDRSMAVKKCYATTLGHVVRIAKSSSTEKLVARLQNWYFEKEDEQFRTACGIVLYEMSKTAPEAFEHHASAALPLAFLAMHDGQKESVWADVWNDVTAGTESGIRSYLPQLLTIAQQALTSQSWPMKAQAARAVKTIIDKSKNGLQQPHAEELIRLLIQGLSGRTWDGKETLLQAFSSVCISCKSVVIKDMTVDLVLEPMFKECKKENLSYKLEALQAYADMVEAFELDKFAQVYELVQPIIDKRKSEEENEEDEEMEEEKNTEASLKFEEGALKILAQLWPSTALGQADFLSDFGELLTENLKNSTWRLQIRTMKTTQTYWERLAINDDNRDVVFGTANALVWPLCKCLVDLKYAAVRSVALDLTTIVLARLRESGLESRLSENVVIEIYDSLNSMITENQPVLAEKVDNVRRSLRTLLDVFESRAEMEVPSQENEEQSG